MTVIPAEWRAILGGPALTGKGGLPIISTNGYGPSATVFDPEAAGSTSRIPQRRTHIHVYRIVLPLESRVGSIRRPAIGTGHKAWTVYDLRGRVVRNMPGEESIRGRGIAQAERDLPDCLYVGRLVPGTALMVGLLRTGVDLPTH